MSIDVKNIIATLGEASMMLGHPPHYLAIRRHRWRFRGVAFPEARATRGHHNTYLVSEVERWIIDAKGAGVTDEERAYHNKYRTHDRRVKLDRAEREASYARRDAEAANDRHDRWTGAAAS